MAFNVCVCNWMAHKYKSLVLNNHKTDNIQHDVSPEGSLDRAVGTGQGQKR